ncbi:MAG: DUF4124 domain-containing protein [Gammaproteobacteria bacterium]
MTRHALLLLVLCAFGANAEVYRYTDEDGNVVFSDTPREGAEIIELRETTVVPAERIRATPRQGKVEPEERGYSQLRIAAPGHEETLRNVQSIAVSVAVEPALRLKEGHRLQLFFDGEAYGDPSPVTSFVLSEVDRGTHQLAVAVVDGDGSEIQRSDSSTFFLHRQSILQPRPRGGAP